jgi:hypothetical protein
MHDTSIERLTLEQYVQRLLETYRNTPGTLGRIRPEDRQLAAQLYRRGIPLAVLETAFALAAARRGFRPFDAPPLNPIRSLHYFLPVLDELLSRPPLPEDYLAYLQAKVQQLRRDPQLKEVRAMIEDYWR